MDMQELLDRAGDQVGVRRVFGEPIERDGVIVVPVAMVAGGGGGGTGPEDQGSGAGFGVWARGIGAYEIREGRVRFVPAIDVLALAVLGLAFARTLSGALRRNQRHHRRHG
jgi:uncharacterized spore protein YtfJ